ncbi:cholecystokinin receptor type A [Nerophis lumbriciformis]|uniref:cholecystokinin receptor type A n=1 Tax=Nerophis lumbriciformis TaxID=546530 RepID=UPI003BA92696
MDAITVHDLLLNTTELGSLLCNLGIKNISNCASQRTILQQQEEQSDINNGLRIFLYLAIFLVGVTGNGIIIAVLSRNKRMWTITNMFLLSLAVSDMMVALVCIPFTLIPNIMKNFVFGSGTCKMVMYFMGISVCVSAFTLVAISLERYSAICKPLTSRTWQTKSHAVKVIGATWISAILLMLPYPFSSTLKPFTRHNNTTGYMCRVVWHNDAILKSWYVSLLVLLFLLPGIIMMLAYGLISLELYRGVRFELSDRASSSSSSARDKPVSLRTRGSDGDGCYVHLKRGSTQSGSISGAYAPVRVSQRGNKANLLSKKRVIRMLLVIVFLFFLCWTPVFVVNTWQAFDQGSAYRLTGAPISFIHLLSYTSTCINPVIYCFMNKHFRHAMIATFYSLRILKEHVINIWGRITGAKVYRGEVRQTREQRRQKSQEQRCQGEAKQNLEQRVEQMDIMKSNIQVTPDACHDPDGVELSVKPFVENMELSPEHSSEQKSQGVLSNMTSCMSINSVRSLLPPELV